jgi:hypothetical protein
VAQTEKKTKKGGIQEAKKFGRVDAYVFCQIVVVVECRWWWPVEIVIRPSHLDLNRVTYFGRRCDRRKMLILEDILAWGGGVGSRRSEVR